jgi:hypothetical protein
VTLYVLKAARAVPSIAPGGLTPPLIALITVGMIALEHGEECGREQEGLRAQWEAEQNA